MLLLRTICRLKSCKIERMDICELEDLTLLLILFPNHCLSNFLELSGWSHFFHLKNDHVISNNTFILLLKHQLIIKWRFNFLIKRNKDYCTEVADFRVGIVWVSLECLALPEIKEVLKEVLGHEERKQVPPWSALTGQIWDYWSTNIFKYDNKLWETELERLKKEQIIKQMEQNVTKIHFFSNFFRRKVRSFMWDFSCFLRQACITINSLLKTAFALSHRFWKVLFLFFFSLKVYFGIISDIFFGPLVF